MILAIIAGYLVGALVAFFTAQLVLGAIAKRAGASAEQRRSIHIVGGLFGAMSLAPSIFMGMMIGGGGLAGHYAGSIARALGWGGVGTLPVLSLALAIIMTLTVTAVAAAGGVLGLVGARALARHDLPPPRMSR
jgi:hypothetical protein